MKGLGPPPLAKLSISSVLPLDVARQFPDFVRERGDRYYQQGRVTLIEVSEDLVAADVRGASLYRSSIRRTRNGELTFSCTCPYAIANGTCKHVWATLVAANATLGVRASEPTSAAMWQTQIRTLGVLMAAEPASAADHTLEWPEHKRLAYILDVHATSLHSGGLVVEIARQRRDRDGVWSEPRPSRMSHARWMAVPNLTDREIAQMLVGAQSEFGGHVPSGSTRRYVVSAAAFETTLRRIVATGRAFMRVLEDSRLHPLEWDDGAPWIFQLRLERHDDGDAPWYGLNGHFARGTDRMSLDEPSVVIRGGLLIIGDRMHRFVDDHLFAVIVALRTSLAVKNRPEAMSAALTIGYCSLTPRMSSSVSLAP